MNGSITLDFVYDELGGPIQLRRNFPRKGEFGFPSLDQQCERFPWATIEPALKARAKAEDLDLLPRIWPHIARALDEFYFSQGPTQLPEKFLGPSGLVNAYERVVELTNEIEQTFVVIDELSLDLLDARKAGRAPKLKAIRDNMWAQIAAFCKNDHEQNVSANRQENDRADNEVDSATSGLLETRSMLLALKNAAGEAADLTKANAKTIASIPGSFNNRLFYLLEALARVWLLLKAKLPSKAEGKHGSQVFTSFVLELLPECPPSGARAIPTVTASRIIALVEPAGKRAELALSRLAQ